MNNNWLVCGTRKKGYKDLVFEELNKLRSKLKPVLPDSIIEGCCPDSADEYAEQWAKENNVKIQHHPSTSGNYLNRNIEMVNKANLLIAFWNNYSYGTAHTIANAVIRNIPIIIINLNKKASEEGK